MDLQRVVAALLPVSSAAVCCRVATPQGPEPKDILDIGCSTGLSTLKLAETFPSARITGVDLSPHMLAVGRYFLRTREEQRHARGRVEYLHAAGEMTGMGDASMDLVSLSLTSHELPAEATRYACFVRVLGEASAGRIGLGGWVVGGVRVSLGCSSAD